MKNITLLLALAVAAIAAPLTTYFGVSAYTESRAASIRHADLKRQQRLLEEYSVQLAEYEQFTARVERFIQSAQTAGVAEEAWNRHHVDIEDRVVSLEELDQFIAEAGGGDNYYFLPSKLQILSPGAGTVENPFRRRGASGSTQEVHVSLTGDYLVRVK